jgi:hypothetical protein
MHFSNLLLYQGKRVPRSLHLSSQFPWTMFTRFALICETTVNFFGSIATANAMSLSVEEGMGLLGGRVPTWVGNRGRAEADQYFLQFVRVHRPARIQHTNFAAIQCLAVAPLVAVVCLGQLSFDWHFQLEAPLPVQQHVRLEPIRLGNDGPRAKSLEMCVTTS